tara:strand:+ start:22116 stop:22556 length:441 start_codon:yes stop_codon:yes gene_type:complete
MNKATSLLEALDELTWDNYVEVADAVTQFSIHRLDDAMKDQASIYSYYQGLLSLAKNRLDDTKLELTKFSATHRKRAKQNSSTKITAKDLDDLVESSDEFMDYNTQVNNAEFKYTLLKGLVASLEQKKDMMVQLSSNRRAETNLYK